MKAEIGELPKWIVKDMIYFGGCMPDPKTFPIREISDIARTGLREQGSKLLRARVQSFFVDGSGENTMRLNFTYPSMEMIDERIQRLGKVIKQKTG